MADSPVTTDRTRAGVASDQRITNLDAVRGIAVLGILAMNVVSFALPTAAYFNVSAGGTETWLDRLIGVAGEIFVDQKMMGLFSLLFGAGIVLFAERVATRSSRPALLSLWRNALLLVIGLLHTLLWDGDVLVVYAICAPILIAMRRLPAKFLLGAGTALVVWPALTAPFVQGTVSPSGAELGDFWFVDRGSMSDAVGLFVLNDFFSRALGMMLIGVALHRLGIVQGRRPVEFYRRMAAWGLGIGVPLAAAGALWQWLADSAVDAAIIGEIPNNLATVPVTLGYLGVITLWNLRPETALHRRVWAAGRMALTNYLTQTIIGVLVLQVLLDGVDLTRTGLFVFVLAVWALQLAWSQPWLERMRYGPFEWLWRVATYRSWQPIRIDRSAQPSPNA